LGFVCPVGFVGFRLVGLLGLGFVRRFPVFPGFAAEDPCSVKRDVQRTEVVDGDRLAADGQSERPRGRPLAGRVDVAVGSAIASACTARQQRDTDTGTDADELSTVSRSCISTGSIVG